MKNTLRVLLVAVLWLPLLLAAALLDALRETRHRRRLGPAYEGPLAGYEQ
ncbi:MAG: hypothetical protein JSS11_08965 [Verrucomicrobia bacterium]|nr:hypothetical protein [Verrucomicrobiota bacterium]